MKPRQTLFITLEGIEGVGKSTCLRFLTDYLSKQHQVPLHVTREPGGTVIGEKIRQVVLSPSDESIADDTELLLFFAARAQHIKQIIKPALAKGLWVLCDRFTDTSYAYQGAGRGMDKERIATLEQWVQGSLRPDLTLLLDAPVDIALGRIKRRGKIDRIESERYSFFERVREGYLQLASEYKHRYRIINASLPITKVFAELKTVLDPYL